MNDNTKPTSSAAWYVLAIAVSSAVAACGGGGDDEPDIWACTPHPITQREATYGTHAPYVTGPLQPAPAVISAAARRPMYVCP